jgi:two-component sensor histidine kinase
MAPHNWEWHGPDGRNYYVFDFPLTDVDGSIMIVEMGIDITERNRAEQEIQKLNRELEERVNERTTQLAAANRELHASEEYLLKTLHEKETLLKEVHHRVKNNLQIIHSMLNLQLSYIKDEQARASFRESQDRIYSMALIHEKLYKSESLVKIDLAEYIRSLTANLFLSYGVNERTIRPEIHVEEISLNINTLIPCALIVNELVSNALKHAFPDAARLVDETEAVGELRIDLRRVNNRQFILSVSDNGIGLPKGFDIESCESLGLKLVKVLAKQLKGTITFRTNGRTEFAITFSE